MTTATATPTPLTPAELAAFYDAQAAAEDAAAAAQAEARQQQKQAARDRLDAAIMAAVDAAGIDGQYLAIATSSNGEDRIGRINMPGFARFVVSADFDGLGPRTWAEYNGVNFGRATTDTIAGVMAAARRKWLEMDRLNTLETKREHEAAGQRQAEAAQRQQHDADALAAWAPEYRRYLDRLIAAHRHNAAILQPIAAELGGREFTAARLTYGITADDADPTTDTTWIAGGGQTDDGYWLEIDRQGQIEPALIFHAVKLSAGRTWTAAAVYEESGSNSSPDTPPIRTAMIRTGAGNWLIAAPPADHYLRSEILAMIAASGQQLERVHSEEIPPPPALWNPSAGEELARRLESEAAGDLDTLAALSGSFAGDFPSADPIPF